MGHWNDERRAIRTWSGGGGRRGFEIWENESWEERPLFAGFLPYEGDQGFGGGADIRQRRCAYDVFSTLKLQVDPPVSETNTALDILDGGRSPSRH